MTEANLTRRKFMQVSSAAMAAPLMMKIAGRESEAKAANQGIRYYISDDCVGCHYCFYECPESAIHWSDDKYVIDQNKCIQCGTCAEVCNIGAAHCECE